MLFHLGEWISYVYRWRNNAYHVANSGLKADYFLSMIGANLTDGKCPTSKEFRRYVYSRPKYESKKLIQYIGDEKVACYTRKAIRSRNRKRRYPIYDQIQKFCVKLKTDRMRKLLWSSRR